MHGRLTFGKSSPRVNFTSSHFGLNASPYRLSSNSTPATAKTYLIGITNWKKNHYFFNGSVSKFWNCFAIESLNRNLTPRTFQYPTVGAILKRNEYNSLNWRESRKQTEERLGWFPSKAHTPTCVVQTHTNLCLVFSLASSLYSPPPPALIQNHYELKMLCFFFCRDGKPNLTECTEMKWTASSGQLPEVGIKIYFLGQLETAQMSKIKDQTRWTTGLRKHVSNQNNHFQVLKEPKSFTLVEKPCFISRSSEKNSKGKGGKTLACFNFGWHWV